MEWTPFMTSSFSRCSSGDAVEVGLELGGERGGDVLAVPEGGLGHVGPPPEGPVGLVQDVQRIGEQPVVGQGQSGRSPLGEALQRVERRGRGRSRAAASTAAARPASGSFTPTASPAKRIPLKVSCSATWCLA